MGMIIVFGLFLGVAAILFILGNLPPKYNSLVWRHPDKGGSIERKMMAPMLAHRPWLYRYHSFAIKHRPLWLFYEKKEGAANPGVRYSIIPYEPAFSGTETPEELYDNCEWTPASRFMTVKSKWAEIIKFGLAIAMVGACLFGIIVLLDMIGGG